MTARVSLLFAFVAPLLAGCDLFYEAIEMPNPSKTRAESKAVGAACRHAGRSLEDCYYLNPELDKAAIFEGWKEMNEYMLAKELPTVPSQFVPLPSSPSSSGGERPKEPSPSPSSSSSPAAGSGGAAASANNPLPQTNTPIPQPLPRNEPIIPNPSAAPPKRS
ncbi:MAG: hypothetical protein N2557_00095 [Hydrogenophilus sp.]|nr:hypothetical protein [Hydrogenophilus sp.]